MTERILIVDEDEALREALELLLASEGYEVLAAQTGPEALARLDVTPLDLVICDARMPGLDGFELVPQIARALPGAPILLMAGPGDGDLAEEALQKGAWGCLNKPFEPSQVRLVLHQAREREHLRRSRQMVARDLQRAVGERPIVAASPLMIELLELLERTAPFKTAVLLSGEPGTGREILARAIHAQSPRRNAPFVAVGCGAIAEPMLESELFGHARGAFAGAQRARRGLFARADHGSIYLDEITVLSPPLQSKLMRAIQEEEIRPVGENKPEPIDVRLIAATSLDLEAEVEAGRFREDLYYRLDVVRLDVPPLRRRREDIPLLVDHFLAHFRERLGKPIRAIADDALERLSSHRWPGNVRELENVIERAMILADGDRLTLSDLPAGVIDAPPDDGGTAPAPDLSLRRARRSAEISAIQRALRSTGGNRTHAAKVLEISHRALLYKIKEFGIRN